MENPIIHNKRFIDLDLNKFNEGWTIVEGGQGSGKTSLYFKAEKYRTIYTSHSNPLLVQVDFRTPVNADLHIDVDTGTPHIATSRRERFIRANHCLINRQSLYNYFANQIKRGDLFFIDEISIYLEQMYNWQINAQHISKLKHLILTYPKIVALGTYIHPLLEEWIREFDDRPITYHQFQFKDLENKKLHICEDGEQLKGDIARALTKNKKVLLITESKDFLKTITKSWERDYPDKKYLRLTGKERPSKEVLETFANPGKRTPYDLIVCSPTLKDGFHIVGEIDLVVGMFNLRPKLHHEELLNFFGRARDCDEWSIAFRNKKNLQKTPDDISNLIKGDYVDTKLLKKYGIINIETGNIEPHNEDIHRWIQKFKQVRESDIRERQDLFIETFTDRGGTPIREYRELTNLILPKYNTHALRERVLTQGQLIHPKDMFKANLLEDKIFTEIVKVFGDANADTWDAYNLGNYELNLEFRRFFDEGNFEKDQVDISKDNKKELAKLLKPLVDQIKDTCMTAYKDNREYTVHLGTLNSSPHWKKLKERKERFNHLCEPLGFKGCEILDKHTSETTTAPLEWLRLILPKLAYSVSKVTDAKSVKQKNSLKKKVLSTYKERFDDWKLSDVNKKKQLMTFLFDELGNDRTRVMEMENDAIDYINCFPHVAITDVSNRNNFIS